MSKIKIKLVSGAVVEKPLVSCFRGTNANYLILDNESVGSMGLPIIAITKLKDNGLEKIIDPNEWSAVKDNLKTIIGGVALPYLRVPEELNAPDDFFTQLTLPVASFDLLKAVYNPPVEEVAPAPVEVPAALETVKEPEVTQPTTPQVMMPTEITLAPAPEIPIVNENTPVMPNMQIPINPIPTDITNPMPMAPSSSEIPMPTFENNITSGSIPTNVSDVNNNLAPAIEMPVTSENNQANVSDMNIELIKETFMKSCENMFDALIKKFQK